MIAISNVKKIIQQINLFLMLKSYQNTCVMAMLKLNLFMKV